MTDLQKFYEEWNNGQDLLLVHTSGSTGAPKPLWVEKRRMLNSARITCDFLGIKPGDTAEDTVRREIAEETGLTAKLDAMSPLKVLTRGYAMAQDKEKKVIRSVKQIVVGQMLDISLSDGVISATVNEIKENV